MLQCDNLCPNPTDELGLVLYSGPFNPHFPAFPTPNHQLQQNFTITVPNFPGQVQLAAVVYTLIGVSAVLFYFILHCCGAVH
jgi:hypothetical protein